MDLAPRTALIRALLETIEPGQTDREGLRATPARVDRAYAEMFSGYAVDIDALTSAVFVDGSCDEMVIVRDIQGFSSCEHHILPFSFTAHVGYIPRGKVIGLSKIARLVDAFARRLQIQERMTSAVADTLAEKLDPLGVMVVVEGKHLCTMARGVKQSNSTMITSAVRGLFREDARARAEFLSLIGRPA
jgi:GTP cyclohydrolase I